MRVGIKYCGGCNPRYDRVAFVEGLKCQYEETDFELAAPGTLYDYLLVVCGCQARCADIQGLMWREIRYICENENVFTPFPYAPESRPLSGA